MSYSDIKKNSIFNSATPEEKEVFLSTLCTLAQIDSKIKPEEMSFIETIANEMKVPLKSHFFRYSQEVCIKKAEQINNRRLGLELIKDLLAIAYTDDNFSDSEGHFICKIGDALKIEAQKIGEISSWLIDHIIWLEQEQLIFETADIKGE